MQSPASSRTCRALPRRGNRLTALIGRGVLRLGGWRIEGGLPEVPRQLVIVAPHTSNWDFVIGIAAVFALRLDAHWVGKHTLFKGLLGPIMRWFGGLPVDRRKSHGAVGQLVDEFRGRERLFLGMTPEGTRSRVARWKTGFYHVAREAEVPLVPIGFDYRRKQVCIFLPFPLTGDLDADLARLQVLFAGVTPKFPHNFNPRFAPGEGERG